MKIALIVFGSIIGIAVLYFFIVSLIPGMSVPGQSLQRTDSPPEEAGLDTAGVKKDVSFKVQGTTIDAWLFLPENRSGPVPCIVMGHGFGGTKDCGLDKYAARFQEAGFAALAFDYRHFGNSGGETRQLAWIPYQLEDWAGAIEYARKLDEIDPDKIALWGSSFSGGHVIVTAAKDHKIACVTAQCPGLDGLAAAKMGFKRVGLGLGLRLLVHAQRDLFRSWLGLSPHKIPLVGKPGTIAFMNTPDAYETFGRIAPKGFINEACARMAIRGDKYRPVKHAANVRCPVLLQVCEKDNLTPMSAARETESELGKYAEVKYYPIGHFDIYLGEYFEKGVTDQIEFYKKHL